MSRKPWKRWLWTGALAAAALPVAGVIAQEQVQRVPPRIAIQLPV